MMYTYIVHEKNVPDAYISFIKLFFFSMSGPKVMQPRLANSMYCDVLL